MSSLKLNAIDTLTAKKVLVTPTMAKKMLEQGNPLNRKIAKNTVRAYADDIRNGLWDDDAVVLIVFDKNGVLRDGHHRLNAIIEAGTPVKLWIVEGAEPSSTYDLGKGRSVNDVLRMNGVDATNNATAMIRTIGSYCFNVEKVPVGEINKAYMTDGYNIHVAVNIAQRGKGLAIARKSPVTAAIYVALKCGVDIKTLIDFAEIVNTGIPKDVNNMAPVIFRNQILSHKARNLSGYESRKQVFFMAQEAIHDYAHCINRKFSYTGKRAVYSKMFIKKFRSGELFNDIERGVVNG